jgi:predicted RNA-binding protein with PIN domain
LPILIDGYNVLHQSGLLGKGRGPGFLERARRALVRFIAASVGTDTVAEVTIVFDAKQVPQNAAPPTLEHGVTVLYSSGYEDADAMLEDLIRRASQPKRLLVVSSDHRVQRAARRRRARSMGAEEWLNELERHRTARAPTKPTEEKPDQPLNDDEFEYWRGIFQCKNQS